jgi:hypothetical protein
VRREAVSFFLMQERVRPAMFKLNGKHCLTNVELVRFRFVLVRMASDHSS